MKNVLLIGLSSAALLYAASANGTIAATGDTTKPAQPAKIEQAGPTDNQIANDVDAKIALLKAELRLTPDQEKTWPTLQTALHDYGAAQLKKKIMAGRSTYESRHEHDGQSKSNDHPNDIAAMRSEVARLTLRAVSLSRLADAAEPIYGVLDDRQKHKLMQFMRSEFEKGR
jgi:hypothetical protein